MKKNYLFALLAMLAGVFSANAANIMINVDKAANVVVKTNYGYGQTLTLEDGLNRFELNYPDDSPVVISAAEGAKIESVVLNQESNVEPGTNGDYTVRFNSGGAMIEITTSGEGGGGTTEIISNFNIYVSGEGFNLTGKPYTFTVEENGAWVPVPAGQYMSYCAAQGKRLKITPDAGYAFVSATIQTQTTPIEGTIEEDGSFVFVNNIPDYYNVYLVLKMADDAIRFTVQVDYPKNIAAYLEYQRDGSGWQTLELTNGVNEFIITDPANPLEFVAATGGEITKVLRNGEEVGPIGWGGTNGYVYVVENGDNFIVTTVGPEIDVIVKSADGNADLDAYYFTRDDGSVVKLSGREATLTGKQGEFIYTASRPGASLVMVYGKNGMEYDSKNWKDWFRIVPGADGTPAVVEMYGSRDVNGVVVDIDNAQAATVTQEGGRGDVLALADGKNQFALSDLKNALAVSNNDGYQIVSVTLNGDLVEVNANGNYMANVADNDYLQIITRKSPVTTNVHFLLPEGFAASSLNMSVDDRKIDATADVVTSTYSTITFSAAAGYEIHGVAVKEESAVTLTQNDGTYELYLKDAAVNDISVMVTLLEKQPSAGNAIVVPNGNPLLISFAELEYISGEDRWARVKTLEANTVNEVKIGNSVQVYLRDSQTKYSYVKVNGTDVACSTRSVMVPVEGRTVIDAEAYSPVYVYGDGSVDEDKHAFMGGLNFEVDGETVSSFYAIEGMTVKFVPEPNAGYLFDHIEMYYPTDVTGRNVDSESHTFTAEDCANEFILFRAVFKVDEKNKTYVLRGSTAWLTDENGNVDQATTTAMGNVVFQTKDGSYARETIGSEGETVHLAIAVNDESIYNEYETFGFCLMEGFPNRRVPTNYVISAADAGTDGVIWICGLMRKKNTSGVDNLATGNFAYDAATQTLYAPSMVKVFSLSGNLVAEAEGTISVATLSKGVYVAVCAGKTLKFMK